jgi:hypothetical protein
MIRPMSPAPAAPRFIGWRIVAASAAIQCLQAGLLHSAFGAYVAVLADEMGCNHWKRPCWAPCSAG